MRKQFTLLLAFLPLIAQSGWIDPTGKAIPDTESMRSAGDFGVQIVLTADEKQFRHVWSSSNTPPRLSTINAARVGEAVSALLIFHGCAPKACGVCDVDSEFTIESPDGSKTPAGGGPVWNEKPVPPQQMQLGQASLTLGFGETDPVGEYKVVANIKDKVSGQALSVLARLKITK